MILKIEVKLSIGLNGVQEDVLEMDAPDDWQQMTDTARQDWLDEVWEDWSGNYIDGYAALAE